MNAQGAQRLAAEVAGRFFSLMRTALYHAQDPAGMGPAAQAWARAVSAALAASSGAVVLEARDGRVAVGNIVLPSEGQFATIGRELTTLFSSRHLAGLTIGAPPAPDQAANLAVHLLGFRPSDPSQSVKELQGLLASLGLTRVIAPRPLRATRDKKALRPTTAVGRALLQAAAMAGAVAEGPAGGERRRALALSLRKLLDLPAELRQRVLGLCLLSAAGELSLRSVCVALASAEAAMAASASVDDAVAIGLAGLDLGHLDPRVAELAPALGHPLAGQHALAELAAIAPCALRDLQAALTAALRYVPTVTADGLEATAAANLLRVAADWVDCQVPTSLAGTDPLLIASDKTPAGAMAYLSMLADTRFSNAAFSALVMGVGAVPSGTVIELNAGGLGVVLERADTPTAFIVLTEDGRTVRSTLDDRDAGMAAIVRDPEHRPWVLEALLGDDARPFMDAAA